MKKVFIAITIAAVPAAAWLLLPGSTGRTNAAAVSDGDKTASVGTIRAMENDITAMRKDIARLRDRPAPPATIEERAARAGESDPEEPLARKDPPARHREVSEVLASLDARLAQESADTDWSRRTESGIAAAFDTEAFQGSKLAHVDCRSTLCRVEVLHESDESWEQFVDAAPATPPFDGGGFAHRTLDGNTSRSVVFVSREGHSLARFDAESAVAE